MQAVVQRVSRAEVRIDGEVVGRIGHGMLVLIGVSVEDTDDLVRVIARKVAKLRIFGSDRRPIDASVLDVGGAALVVSQFTLCADTRRGNRPSFVSAAPPEEADRLYGLFCEELRGHGVVVETGVFAATLGVELVNAGPVTIVLRA